MWLIKKAGILLCCFILCGLIGCGNPDTTENSDTYSGDFKSDESMADEKTDNEKTTVSINNYISVNTKESEPSDDTDSSSQPQNKEQHIGNVETVTPPGGDSAGIRLGPDEAGP